MKSAVFAGVKIADVNESSNKFGFVSPLGSVFDSE